MKATDHQDIVILGKLQMLHDSMNIELPKDAGSRKKFRQAKRLVYEVLDSHWETCNKFISEDDT